MKYLIFLLTVLLISCNRQKEVPAEDTPVPQSLPELPPAKKTPNLEDEVFNAMDSLNKATDATRKKHLVRVLSYHDKVDGAIAEGYGDFAYKYVELEPKKFYGVLTAADSIIIKSWAGISAPEVMLIAENTNGIDSLWNYIKANHTEKQKSLTPAQIKLDKIYLDALRKEVNAAN